MSLSAWSQRSEQLGFLVLDDLPAVGHLTVGDRFHRFVVRNPDLVLVASPSVYLPLRAIVACAATGRRIACCLSSADDVSPAARRLHKYSPGHMGSVSTAVFDGVSWSEHKLHELAV